MKDTRSILETLDNQHLAERLARLEAARRTLEELQRQLEAEIGAREWEGTWQAKTGVRA